MTQEAIIVRQLTLDEAQVITDKIKSTAESLWELLLEAWEGKAWGALGYTSWQAYVMVPGDIFTKIRNRSKSNLLELKRHCRRSIDSLMCQPPNHRQASHSQVVFPY